MNLGTRSWTFALGPTGDPHPSRWAEMADAGRLESNDRLASQPV